jgi:hypothetical protein
MEVDSVDEVRARAGQHGDRKRYVFDLADLG